MTLMKPNIKDLGILASDKIFKSLPVWVFVKEVDDSVTKIKLEMFVKHYAPNHMLASKNNIR